MSQIGTLSVGILGDTSGLKSALDGAQKHVDGFGGTVAKIGGMIAGAFAVKKIADFVGDSVKEFAEFEAATTKMFATMDPLPEATKQAIISDIKDISNQYGILAKDVTAAYDVAGDLGVPTEGLKEFMGPAAQLAKVLGTDIETAAKALAVTVQGLGGDFEETAAVADLFFKVAETGDVDITTLQTAFAKLLPVTKDLGIDMNELAAYIATVSQQGVPARSAISGIQAALDELSDPASDVAALFEELSEQTFKEFIESGGTLEEALTMIAESAAETGTPLTQLFKSAEAGKTVLLTTGESADLLRKNIVGLGDAASGVADSYGRMSGSLQEQLGRFKTWWDNLKIDLGGKLQAPLQALLTWLSEHQDEIVGFITLIVDTISAVLEIVGPVIQGILSLLGGIVAFLKGDWAGAWEGLEGFLKGIWDAVLKVFEVTGITDLFTGMFETIKTAFTTFITAVGKWGQAIIDAIWNGLKTSWHLVTDWFANAWDSLIDALTSWLPGFLKKWLGIGEDSAKKYAEGIEAAKGEAEQAAQVLVDTTINTVSAGVADFAAAAQEFAFVPMRTMGEALVDGLEIGIMLKLPELEDTIAGIGTTTQNAFEEAFQTQSPSKITEQIGRDVGQGLVDGLASMQRDIAQESKMIANTMVNTIAGGIEDTVIAVVEGKKTIGEGFSDIVHEVLLSLARQLLGFAAYHAALAIMNLALLNFAGAASEASAALAAGVAAAGMGIFEAAVPFASGGMVAGALGEPVPAIVHGGEMVLTPEQQRSGLIDYEMMSAAMADALEEVLPGKDRPLYLVTDGKVWARTMLPFFQGEEKRLGLVTP